MKRIAIVLAMAIATSASAHGNEPHQGGIKTSADKAVLAEFDIVHTKVTTEGNVATFHMAVSGKAGKSKPAVTGKLAGTEIFSYVWPTTIDPYEVGFEHKAGIHGTGGNIPS